MSWLKGMPGCQYFDYLRTSYINASLNIEKPINIHGVRAARARRTAREGRDQETCVMNSTTRDVLYFLFSAEILSKHHARNTTRY